MPVRINRRQTLRIAAGAGAGYWLGTTPAAARSPSEKLNIGIIGAGGKGESNILGVLTENVVAVCDVDDERATKGFRMVPKARHYRDFRKMLDEEPGLDAVMVSTPDHTHALAAIAAMRRGKHVYCEKPLAHSIAETRAMRQAAREQKVATQMGNQGHSGAVLRQAVKLVRSGGLGAVREFHAWTNRPSWPQPNDRPTESAPVPKGLDWNLWLGPAPERPYHPAYCPFKWRGWWDFGTGALGDMACHVADLGFWGLDLDAPTAIEAKVSDSHPESPPKWSVIRFEFPARGAQPPVVLTWYDGGKKPDPALVGLPDLPGSGSILVGDRATMYVPDEYGRVYQVLPRDSKEPRPKPPAPATQLNLIGIAASHYREWIAACKGGPAALSNFDEAAKLTEAILLGNVAIRLGKRIEWNAKEMKVVGCPEADPLIQPAFRAGWTL